MHVEIMWRRSSLCTSVTNCIEVAAGRDQVLMRDGKDPDGPVLTFTLDEWDTFVAGARAGEFDLR